MARKYPDKFLGRKLVRHLQGFQEPDDEGTHWYKTECGPNEFDPRLAKALNDRGLVSGDWWFLVHHKDPTVGQIEKQLKTRFYDDGTPILKVKK